jgi:hypothetical protein
MLGLAVGVILDVPNERSSVRADVTQAFHEVPEFTM